MNLQERLALWVNILAQTNERLATLDARLPNLEAGLRHSIRQFDHNMAKNARGFINYYEEKIAQHA